MISTPEIEIVSTGTRKLVKSSAGIVLMTSADKRKQLARITMNGKHYVFPTYNDIDSEQEVRSFEHLGSTHFLLEDYTFTEEVEICIPREIAIKLSEVLCIV